LSEVYQFVDRNSNLFLKEFKDFIRKPGISTENTGIEETLGWLVSKMKENGIENVQTFETQRHPVILGRVGKAAKLTLLVYGHYDVQPPGERRDWKVDPFAAEVVDGRIIGRGTCDMKNNLMASIHAVKALLDSKKSLPINLVFLFEGEEEIGSPNLRSFIEEHKADLTCDSILCGEGGESKTGQALMVYGFKGMLSFELLVKSAVGVEIHSQFAGTVDNPAWRLVSALNSLKQDDKVLIPHFYADIKEPSLTQKIEYGLARVAVSKKQLEEAFELKIKKGMSVSEALLETFYKPTFNINGLSSGYTVMGGEKTIVPDSAWARIDMRLVPEQEPLGIFENINKYLQSKGFTDVEVKRSGFALPPYMVDSSERIVKVVKEALKKVVSKKIMDIPIAPYAGAMVWLPRILNKPMACAGSGAGYMAHRPNEFITQEQYLKGIKLFATIYNSYAS